ncbi:MAG: hypothetical protein EA397_19305 [Deltaproteobacteria bacterium]|nr:MAG: hypothetical protein EA397_19305 [Deltaproteobacteria bacterium]
MRWRPLLAIATRDLAVQLRGRRGFVLPLIAGLLLVPLASVPFPELPAAESPLAIPISGDVPPALKAHEGLEVVPRSAYHFEAVDQGIELRAEGVPHALRQALDEAFPSDRVAPVEYVHQPRPPLPGRTLLLALIAASILTGAVSESLPGERGRKTLEALLTAAVSRGEVVVGKWMAWGGAGALLATLAGLIAVLAGTAELGTWLLTLPLVAPSTVALGFFLVHRTSDLVGGATVSLRILPAALSILGLVAWGVGLFSPALGALVPLGGALVAAGGTWPGWTAPVLAFLSTGTATLLFLAAAANGLERTEARGAGWPAFQNALGLIAIALAWWGCLLTPMTWGPAGNPTLADQLSLSAAVGAAALGLGIVVVTRAAQPQGWPSAGLVRPRKDGVLGLVGAAAITAVVLISPIPSWIPDTAGLISRLDTGFTLWAAGPLVAILAVLTQEVAFRGLFRRALGPMGAAIAFVVLISPHRPVEGLALALVLGWLADRTGSVLPGIIGRTLAVLVVWAAVPLP